MAVLGNILCPVDLSAVSRCAATYAAALGRVFDAKLHVLEVVDGLGRALPSAHWGAGALGGQARREAREHLETFLVPVRSTGVRVDAAVTEGEIIPEILAAAETSQADLIVMGTHGRHEIDRLILGSVTEQVLRQSSCPVLAVPPCGPAGEPSGLFRTVVCAVDFGPASIRGIDYAQMLVAPGGRLILAHSVGWPFGDGIEEMPPDVRALCRTMESEAVGRLHRAATAGPRADIFLEEAVAAGAPYSHILRCAHEEDANLIVMGLHSHANNQLAVLGSTTHHVLCGAPCPVLTVSDGLQAASQKLSAENVFLRASSF